MPDFTTVHPDAPNETSHGQRSIDLFPFGVFSPKIGVAFWGQLHLVFQFTKIIATGWLGIAFEFTFGYSSRVMSANRATAVSNFVRELERLSNPGIPRHLGASARKILSFEHVHNSMKKLESP